MNKKIETTMAAKATYKRLGDYIQLVDVRNQDLKVETLLGLSVEKRFFPSIANTIGTDMSTYKIIESGQFVYIADTSRRGDKIAIALYDKNELAIVSQAYSVFEITDEEQLCPDYLMMWFRRPEFDRYARFKSHGSAREIFDWETMCDVMVPIPSIEEQRKTVAEYQTLVKRIEINNQLIAKLEDTAQAIYRNMFVDGIDKENLPEGWKMGTLGELCKISAGGDRPKIFSEIRTTECSVPIFSNGIEKDGLYGYTNKAIIFDNSITISARGTIGFCCLRTKPYVPIVRLIVIIPNNKNMTNYLCKYLSKLDFEGSGSVQNQLTVPYLINQEIIIPPNQRLIEFEMQLMPIQNNIDLFEIEVNKLKQLQSLLLAKIGQ